MILPRCFGTGILFSQYYFRTSLSLMFLFLHFHICQIQIATCPQGSFLRLISHFCSSKSHCLNYYIFQYISIFSMIIFHAFLFLFLNHTLKFYINFKISLLAYMNNHVDFWLVVVECLYSVSGRCEIFTI